MHTVASDENSSTAMSEEKPHCHCSSVIIHPI
jgi:hypothetical protein